MSKQQVRVASLLLREGFGSLVEEVGTHLLKHGASSLAEIIQATGLKTNQVHLQQNLVLSCSLCNHNYRESYFSIPPFRNR